MATLSLYDGLDASPELPAASLDKIFRHFVPLPDDRGLEVFDIAVRGSSGSLVHDAPNRIVQRIGVGGRWRP